DYLVGACPAAPDEDAAGPTGEGSYGTYTWEAYQEGDVVRNWQGWDTFGQEVSLYNFCGNYMLVTLSAAWCGPCQDLAEELTDVQAQVREEYPNFVVYELLYQNVRGNTPTTDQLVDWKETFELDGIPVVGPEDAADPELALFERDGYIPTSVILSPELEVLSIDEYLTSARDIKSVLEAHAARK
ncbi:MAG: TlpA family protein disulfide reductase, partial [Myxococcota bacterium]